MAKDGEVENLDKVEGVPYITLMSGQKFRIFGPKELECVHNSLDGVDALLERLKRMEQHSTRVTNLDLELLAAIKQSLQHLALTEEHWS